jgi:hypothetical protein
MSALMRSGCAWRRPSESAETDPGATAMVTELALVLRTHTALSDARRTICKVCGQERIILARASRLRP